MSGAGAGHRKAVSYVRWLSDGEVVSASTDSTLRLWDLHTARESRVFRGHVNEKNFVGLAADSEFIACGSETNEVLARFPAWTGLCTALDWSVMLHVTIVQLTLEPCDLHAVCRLRHAAYMRADLLVASRAPM